MEETKKEYDDFFINNSKPEIQFELFYETMKKMWLETPDKESISFDEIEERVRKEHPELR